MANSSILVTQGTQTAVAGDAIGGTQFQVIKLDVGGAGLSSPFTGTLLELTNQVAGTITALAKGTISTGTINSLQAGTIDTVSQFPPNTWGTTITSGTSTLGTIKPAVAGSAIFITDLIISAGTTTTLVIGAGGTSTPVIGTLSFAQYGGLVSNFRVPGSVTSGSALVYQQSANNTLSITASGFVR